MSRQDLIALGKQIKFAKAIRWLDDVEAQEWSAGAAVKMAGKMIELEARIQDTGNGKPKNIRWNWR